ncbi:hypothetical protein RVR_P145 (plasmid) [Actinacidiphila reveromycinica]|uniref:Uncharacterized protein n=1 Tax=Actinacidiphila reveromycinica TaxID=659352 RepID=A0A7U3LG94_9ACTN|nr:hypothetical protein [Streptomyces sp. SN-593]BBG20669.1 hypothetical protein RVR_P145 [Streptomyces sp. SN-593]
MSKYTPVDITPPELQPSALTHHVPDWAEAAPTPTDVHDWDRRREAALVPFELDDVPSEADQGNCGRPQWCRVRAGADPHVDAEVGAGAQPDALRRWNRGAAAARNGLAGHW